MFLILGFMQGLTTGFTVLTSQRFGAGDESGLKRSVGNAAILSVIVTVLATVITETQELKPNLTLHLNQPKQSKSKAALYYSQGFCG